MQEHGKRGSWAFETASRLSFQVSPIGLITAAVFTEPYVSLNIVSGTSASQRDCVLVLAT